MTEIEEENVCVSCRAATTAKLTLRTGWTMNVCAECNNDGSFVKWLEGQIEEQFKKSGYIASVDEHGRTLYAAPPAA